MRKKIFARRVGACVALTAVFGYLLAPIAATAQHVPFQPGGGDGKTKTPIKHVIVIIGENRSFDHLFATYQPKPPNTVWNLLSERVVQANGLPGPNYAKAYQPSAVDFGGATPATDHYSISPGGKSVPKTLPPPLAGGPKKAPFASAAAAAAVENGLEASGAPVGGMSYDYSLLTTGGTGQTAGTPDRRITYDGQPVTHLPPGPFQLSGPSMPYDAYTQSPVHRFYQMWQQLDCNAGNATSTNNSGCLADLFSWVEVTIGAGSNGAPQPTPFTEASTGEGSTALGFYNVATGDAPYFKSLADNYAMSDNYHQAVNGGTGVNHIMLGDGDAIYFSNPDGSPGVPPNDVEVATGTANAGVVAEIEDPNPAPGTNNWYIEDGYGAGSLGSPSSGGGSYSECHNPSNPGVEAVVDYLKSLSPPIDPHCLPRAYYLLNNYNPGYFGDGTNAYADANNNNTVFTIPPSNVPSIGDTMLAHDVSWAYFGDQWNLYKTDPYVLNPNDEYCAICNPFQYETGIMANPAVRTAHLLDTTDLYSDIANGTLPAVSFVKPSGFLDGHPASSKLDLFEGFTKKIVDAVRAQPRLWASTAIFITFDEGGGYYDSGYVQPLDFFGDGTRVPLIVVSRYATPGHISHAYADHVSILKFIERNWSLPPVTSRSRDNFPNPITAPGNAYVPLNRPAITDLFDLFNFRG